MTDIIVNTGSMIKQLSYSYAGLSYKNKLPPTLVGGLLEMIKTALAEKDFQSVILFALAQFRFKPSGILFFLQKSG